MTAAPKGSVNPAAASAKARKARAAVKKHPVQEDPFRRLMAEMQQLDEDGVFKNCGIQIVEMRYHAWGKNAGRLELALERGARPPRRRRRPPKQRTRRVE